ncbi:MAG: hydroxymethylpyrimidine/phosphomethylpyrimidine kinase [Deltaproteobacteria bacterium]|jgi:hydroxymethylpyrimidine/phosphomethylpyrimidine kinase|nr:MAG: hydroxymethylpyrimidine/phosphomethylpyrimidine kinase [Deltaproteobacteria bacterium]
MKKGVPRALTIAGSDSGGGAGIQADLKTFTTLGVFGMSAITSLTAQNTQSVLGIKDIPADFVKLQIDAVVKDIGVDAAKTGMLSNEEIILAVTEKIEEYGINKLVVDPVMRSKSGAPLLKSEAEKALKQRLLPLAFIVTPNLPEAMALSELDINTVKDMKEAARRIKSLGPRYVLVKGGHLTSSQEAIDILYDGKEFYEFKAPRIETKNTHGTGCTYSAAICASLAKGFDVVEAVREAKIYVTEAIRSSFNLGSGYGPLNHFWILEKQ